MNVCFSVTTLKDNSLHMEVLIRGLLLNGFHFLALTKRINVAKETWRLNGLKSSYLWIVIIAVFKFCDHEPFLFSLFLCVHGCFACMFIYAQLCALCPRRPDNIRFETGTKDSEPPWGCWGPSLGPLQQQQVFWAAAPSLQPLITRLLFDRDSDWELFHPVTGFASSRLG